MDGGSGVVDGEWSVASCRMEAEPHQCNALSRLVHLGVPHNGIHAGGTCCLHLHKAWHQLHGLYTLTLHIHICAYQIPSAAASKADSNDLRLAAPCTGSPLQTETRNHGSSSCAQRILPPGFSTNRTQHLETDKPTSTLAKMAACSAPSDRCTNPRHRIRNLGINPASCTEEEDVAHEEEAQAVCWQGTQGRYSTQHLLELR